MNWPTRPQPEQPALSTTRSRTVFAWLPKACSDGRTRWLCRVRRTQVFRSYVPWFSYTGAACWDGWRPFRYDPLRLPPVDLRTREEFIEQQVQQIGVPCTPLLEATIRYVAGKQYDASASFGSPWKEAMATIRAEVQRQVREPDS